MTPNHARLRDVLGPASLKSMDELAELYAAQQQAPELDSLDLGDWLPSFRRIARPLVRGELCFVMADTGVGKSMALQNIAVACARERSLFFELELPGALLWERWAALQLRKTCDEVNRIVKAGTIPPLNLDDCYVCDATRLTWEQMAECIEKHAPAKCGAKPLNVFVDYIGLMGSSGKSRYERVSVAAEDLKVLAKTTNTIVVASTQRARPDRDSGESGDTEPHLHDAKDSGSIENSAGMLLGMWRTDRETLRIKVLKNTKGKAGDVITCNIDGARMRITERVHGVTAQGLESAARFVETRGRAGSMGDGDKEAE